MSDTKVTTRPYIIGPTSSFFVVPTGVSPSYSYLADSFTNDTGAGNTPLTFDVTITPGCTRIVVAVLSTNGQPAAVSVGGVACTSEAATSDAGVNFISTWTVNGATVGSGTKQVSITAAANFSILEGYAAQMFGTGGTAKQNHQAGTFPGAASPYNVAITPSSGQLLFAIAISQTGTALSFSGSTEAPDETHQAGSAFATKVLFGAWLVNTPSFTTISTSWTGGNANTSVAAIVYGA